MEYPYLFFDADNTLFDFARSQEWALEQTLTEMCGTYEQVWLHKYVEVNDRLFAAFEKREISLKYLKQNRFRIFAEKAGLEINPRLTGELYLENLAKCTFLIDDAEEVVNELAKKGHRMILITNGLRVVQRPRFSASPITRNFEAIIISDEVGVAKPNPAIFDLAMEHFGHPPKKKVLMIGDSLTADMQGGINFGIDTCWFNPSDRSSHGFEISKELNSLKQLLDLVEV